MNELPNTRSAPEPGPKISPEPGNAPTCIQKFKNLAIDMEDIPRALNIDFLPRCHSMNPTAIPDIPIMHAPHEPGPKPEPEPQDAWASGRQFKNLFMEIDDPVGALSRDLLISMHNQPNTTGINDLSTTCSVPESGTQVSPESENARTPIQKFENLNIRGLSKHGNPAVVPHFNLPLTPAVQSRHSPDYCSPSHESSHVTPQPGPLDNPSFMMLLEDGDRDIVESYVFQYCTSKREPCFVDLPIPSARPAAGTIMDEPFMKIFMSPMVCTSHYYSCFLF
jgi:hypothetical protein